MSLEHKGISTGHKCRGVYPLAYNQRALWFDHQLDPASSAYNIAVALRLPTHADLAIVRRAFQRLVDRHAALRTTFCAVDGEPCQVVHEHTAVAFRVEDASSWDQALLDAKMAAEAAAPFDLEQGPLLRVTLLRNSPQGNLLLVVVHHIISDMWSQAMLLAEVPQLYQAELNGSPAALKPPRVEYVDHVCGQLEMLDSPAGEAHWQFWREQLGGDLPILRMPTDRPRLPGASDRSGSTRFTIPLHLAKKLLALAKAQGTTIETAALALFQVLLYRYTSQKDILVGVSRAGRSAKTARTFGYFVNPVVLRGNLAGDATFGAFLAQLGQTMQAVAEHDAYPLAKLAERLQPDRDLSHATLFQAMFTWQKTMNLVSAGSIAGITVGLQGLVADIDGIQLELLPLEPPNTPFDLTLQMAEVDGALHGTFVYKTELFDPATIQHMAGHFETLLRGAVAEPEQPVSRLPLLTEDEREQILVRWNDTASSPNADPCVDLRFEAQAARTPDAVAVSMGAAQLSYQELNQRANRLSHYLQRLGVKPGDLVGIAMERSPEMVLAMLAVLKAGAAYVPLDPRYPPARLAYMLDDARVSVLLTQRMLVKRLPDTSARLVFLDGDRTPWLDLEPGDGPLAAQEISDYPASRAAADSLAYVIYTSGSTGEPKGVMVEHRGLCNLVGDQIRAFGLHPGSRVLQFASPSFDASVSEIFTALLSGATLVLAPQEMLASPPELLHLLRSERISTVTLPPTMLAALPDTDLPALQTIVSAGESCPVDVAARWKGNRRFINAYGPTEATVCSAYYEVGELPQHATSIPIGRPLANTQLYVVDEHLQPVPVGVTGELAIGGVGVARGYLNRPEQTAEKFVPNPFVNGSDNGHATPWHDSRLYRTGDLVRFLPDGNIEFLGRRDNQVKLRGFRVELEDIEAALRDHPAIREAAVAARSTSNGRRDTYLVAYLVLEPGAQARSTEVRSLLAQKLPDHMVPATYVLLDALPLTPAGKIDRHRLPEPSHRPRLVAHGTLVPPRTPVEAEMVAIWREVLGLEAISVHDNFFELGGHSLLATQVVSRVGSVFGIDLPLRSVFEAPSVAGLSERVASLIEDRPEALPEPIVPVLRNQDLPLAFSQERMWLVHQLQPDSSAYNIPVTIRLQGQLDAAALQAALDQFVARHEILRTVIVAVDGQPVQRVMPVFAPPFPLIDLTGLPAGEREPEALRLCQEHAREPFNLAAGPLLRAQLVRLDPTDYVLQVTFHHAVADAWALRVAAEEIAHLYTAIRSGQPSLLPESAIQYADFAYWQRRWFAGDRLDAQLAYWRDKLAGVPVLSLPTDHARPAVQRSVGALEFLDIADEVLDELRSFSHGENSTLFMTLLAAFYVLLYRYSGQSDLAVGVPIANRHWMATERMMGTLVNTLVLRTELEPTLTFRQLLQRVREVALEAYAHQDLPFEQLVSALRPRRDLSHAPLFQVMFDFTNVPMPTFDVPGLLWSPLEIDRGAAQFDLTLSVVDTSLLRRVSIEYNTDLFEASTVKRMLGHLHRLLEAVLANPDEPVARLAILTEQERRQLLVEWNAAEADYARTHCLQEAVEAQARRRPGGIALTFGDQYVTYAELDRQAENLAGRLRQLGVGPDVPVGVCMLRSPEMIVGLLGVLKAGGAYVPLDPSFPEERLRYIVADSGMPVLVTVSNLDLAHNLVERTAKPKTRIVELDKALGATTAPERNTVERASPDNLAYIMYTSGSTGVPKGVEVPHRAVMNFLASMARSPGLSVDDVWLSVTTFAFDISVLEFFLPLVTGARVVLAGNDEKQDSRLLAELLASSGATVMQATPAAWRMLIEAGWAGDGRLKMLCGGEALPADLAAALLARGGELWNMYGPTETTIWSTLARIDPADPLITIGRPIANTPVYVVDDQGELAPVGVAGELWIGGDGVARGYRNRPEQTAHKFLPDPFRAHPDARVYRTGDLVRYLSDGRIDYLGRIDSQVKVRGFRVELGEIEARLNEHPQVRQAAVVASRDALDQNSLLAYVVPEVDETSEPLSEASLRRHLQQFLPDYMIPAAYEFLEALPLTPNGKINRKELPAPVRDKARTSPGVVQPRTVVEAELQAMWQDLLQVHPVGIKDDFFELGGHSLLAVRLFALVEDVFGVRLPLTVLYKEATIEHLAAVIDQFPRTGPGSSLVALQPLGAKPPFFAVHGITGDLLWFAELAHHLAPDQPFYGIEAPALHSFDDSPSDIQTLARQYLSMIRESQPEGPYYLGGASFGGAVALEMAQQLRAQGEEVALLAVFDHELPNAQASRSGVMAVAFLAYLAQLVSNLPRWLLSLRDLSLERFLDRLRRYIRLATNAVDRALRPARHDLTGLPADRLMDYVDDLPEHRRRLIEAHYQALRSYVPAAYKGRIVLFKSRARPLFGVFAPEASWKHVAGGGVEVVTVPGSHEGMFRGANAEVLACQLKAAIEGSGRRPARPG